VCLYFTTKYNKIETTGEALFLPLTKHTNLLACGLYFVAKFDKNRGHRRCDFHYDSHSEKVAEVRNKNNVFDYEPQALFRAAQLVKNSLGCGIYFIAKCDKLEATGDGIFIIVNGEEIGLRHDPIFVTKCDNIFKHRSTT
jgi:hypothetical protein